MVERKTLTREERGLAIAETNNQVKRIDADAYMVKSQSHHGEYAVSKDAQGWRCGCPDYVYRHVKCKHIFAVEFSVSLRAEVAVRRIKSIENLTECIFCGSPHIVGDGVRHNKHGDIQKFYCKDCQHYFTFNIGFERMKHNPQVITSAMQLYFTGESLRNVTKALRLLGVEVSHQTVYNWIRKYVRLMDNYLEKIKPNVSDTWRADELYIKIKGNMKYLFAMMDDETRFWIAQEVADTKLKHDARVLFHSAIRVTGKQPKTLITDGLRSYAIACDQVFDDEVKHIRHITLQGDRNNNKMERLNGEIRDREKTMRGLKRRRTPILSGYQIFHNYIREHEGLNGKTPAEACGIKVEGNNKWITLIQNASFQKHE
jgi:transposase-like protein